MNRLPFYRTVLVLAAGSPFAQSEKSFVYSPVGKRDPFTPAISRSVERTPATLGIWERFPVEKLQLKAIMKGFGRPRALFEDPEGKTFVLVEGDFIGREHAILSRVIDSDVLITEHTKNYLGAETLFERILTLRPNDEENFVGTQSQQQEATIPAAPEAKASNTVNSVAPIAVSAPVDGSVRTEAVSKAETVTNISSSPNVK